jgi:F-type H+-transporting ATPase subunit delta
MLPKLEGYTAAVVSSLSDDELRAAVTQLESVDATIQTRGDLRAALTDTAISASARSAVLRELLTGKVDDIVVRVAAYAARVSAGQDLPSVLSDLTFNVLAHSRPEPYVAPPLSLLSARKRVAGYADAILEQLDSEKFVDVEDDLFRWARTIESNLELRRILVDRDAPLDSRTSLVRTLLAGKVSDASLLLALYVIEGGRPRDVVGTLDYLVDYIARARDWRVARVWSARALDDDAKAALVESLIVITGHPVELQVVEDPDLLGGVLIQVGDLRLDATTKGRLGALHDSIAAGTSGELLNRNS